MDYLNLKSKQRALEYHVACAEQYRSYFAALPEKMRAKPESHAAWHDRHAEDLRREITSSQPNRSN